MSHIAKAKNFKITDLDVLDAAAKSLGLELVREQKKYRTYGINACDHAIRKPGDKTMYEIGVLADGAGKFDLGYDSFAGGKGLMDIIGHDCQKLKQNYSAQLCASHWQGEGLSVTQYQTEDGRLFVKAIG